MPLGQSTITTHPYSDVIAKHGIPKPTCDITAVNDAVIDGSVTRADVTIQDEDTTLIAEYVMEDSDELITIFLLYNDEYDYKHNWIVTIQHGDPVTESDQVFTGDTPSFDVIDKFITHVTDAIVETNQDCGETEYQNLWENVVLAVDPVTETQNTTVSDTGIEKASNEYHKHRIQSNPNTTVAVTITHAVQISESGILIKFSYLGEDKVIELPHLNTADTDAWRVHETVLGLPDSNPSQNNDNTEDFEITLKDYIGNTIELDTTTLEDNDSNSDTCTINGIDHPVEIKSIRDYVDEHRFYESSTMYNLSLYNPESRRPNLYHSEITSNSTEQLEVVLLNEVLPDNTVLQHVTALARYHNADRPLECVTELDPDGTDETQLTVTFNTGVTDFTLTKTYTIPTSNTDPEYTDTIVNDLGGGEVKYIEHTSVYAIPLNAYNELTSDVTLETIGNDAQYENWVLVTKQQYQSWLDKKQTQERKATLELIAKLGLTTSLILSAAMLLNVIPTHINTVPIYPVIPVFAILNILLYEYSTSSNDDTESEPNTEFPNW